MQVANNLKTVFENGNLGNGDEREAFLRFWDAFSGILWDPHRLQAQKSAVSFPLTVSQNRCHWSGGHQV